MALRVREPLVVACLLLAAGCARGGVTQTPRLPQVPALAVPALPPWIASISPTTHGSPLAQVRVIFMHPVIPVERLETPAERAVLAHFAIFPALPGTFVILTPRMIAFAPQEPYPAASRIRVTLEAGMHDLAGHRLERDLAWTFETGALKLTAPPGHAVTGLLPKLEIQTNAVADVASLRSHARFTFGGRNVAAVVATPAPSPSASPAPPWTYTISPAAPLPKATAYALAVDSGVLPADGNLASRRGALTRLRTYGPLRAVLRTPGASAPDGIARFAPGDPLIGFTNPVDPRTLAGNVAVSNAAAGPGRLASLADDGKTLSINPYRLSPDHAYSVTLMAGLRDAFGQPLSGARSLRIVTGHLAPYLWAPSGSNTFVRTGDLQLQYTAVNLRGNRYYAAYARVTPQRLASTDDANAMLPAQANWSPVAVPHAQRDHASLVNVPVGERLNGGGTLAYGVAAGRAPATGPYYGMVTLTNLAVAAQLFPEQADITVQHLSDGAPVAGAHVSVYVSNLFRQTGNSTQPCASGTTDAAGTLALGGAGIDVCYAGDQPAYEAPSLLVAARSGSDWAYVRVAAWSGVGSFDGDMSWTQGQPLSRGAIFSDRDMYQPGERAWLTAVCYVLQNGTLRADRNARYNLRWLDPEGHTRTLAPRTTNAFATFSFPLDFAKSAPLGYYTVTATSPAGAEITGTFRVAEFKPPNFSVSLALGRSTAVVGERITANGSARYLFGTPMTGADATLHVTRDFATFAPSAWSQFTFGRQWFWPDQQPDVPFDVLSRPVTLDPSGRMQAPLVVDPTLPYAMTYRVDLEVSDVSHLSSSDTQTFLALPTAQQIGLSGDFVATAGTATQQSVIVCDASGRALAGQRVHLVLQKVNSSSVTQVVEGSEAARNAVTYATVAQADVTSRKQPVSTSLTPPAAGMYRVRAKLAGAASDAGATDSLLWVTGPGEATWAQQNPSDLPLRLDKVSYRAGDEATLALASPYAKADLYLEVVRDRVLARRVVHLDGRAPRVRIPIAQTSFPNAAVYAVLVRRGAPLDRTNLHGLESLVRIGMAPIKFDLRPQYAKLSIAVQRKALEPGARQHVVLHLRDGGGKPLRGQFTVIVANDAVLRLSGYRPPDLVKIVYADQPIAMRFADNRPGVTLTQPGPPAEKGWGYGGGFLAGAAGTRVRTRFLPLAYFNGAIVSNAAGEAAFDFTLPDDLTTWRVMAVATACGAPPSVMRSGMPSAMPRFATADTTFLTTKPLVTNALLPQFARSGDRIDAGLSLLDTGAARRAHIEAVLGGALQFGSGSRTTRETTQSVDTGISALRFSMSVGSGAGATMRIATRLGEEKDAFSVPLRIRNADVTETRVDSGVAASEARIPFAGRQGTLRVSLAASLVPQLGALAPRALEATADDPFLWSLASRLGIAASLGDRTQGARAAASLSALQRSDGGFGFWPGARDSDAYGSAQAVDALAYAQRNGVAVAAPTLARAKPYLARALADPHGADPDCSDANCKARLRLALLQALSAAGERRTDFLQSLFAQRDDLSAADRIALGVYLTRAPGWSSQAAVLANEIEQSVYVDGRYANAAAQATYLDLLLARDAEPERIDRAQRALLAQTCRCGWPSLQDTDAALRALRAAAQRAGPPGAYTATLVAGPAVLASAHVDGRHSPSVTLDTARIPPGTRELVLRKRGSGTLHYVFEYTYRLPADAPGRMAGLRVAREIRAVNQTPVLAHVGLSPLRSPLALEAGRVFDVAVSLTTDHPVERVMLTDPLPAGFEAVDTSFQTSAAYAQPLESSWQIDYQQIFADRVIAVARHLDPGVYVFHYLARSVTPGTYTWPGATASLIEAPDQFGRTAPATIMLR